ncbi:hypothetical protein M1N87_02530 [Dehalococcoidia bacterium]|nr:hypothetical protein [Dehalococcoidia bacterium]
MSTGAYGYPLEQAARTALGTVIDFLKEDTSLEEVHFVLFNSQGLDAYSRVLEELQP